VHISFVFANAVIASSVIVQLSSSNALGQSSGSRRVAVSSSRDAFIGAESDVRTRTAEASPGVAHRILGGQRSSPIGSSDPQRVSRAGRNASQANNYESALRGMEGLQLENDERTHY
jgi:casein kinase 1